MQPLVAELISLWHDGVLTYDVSRKQDFVMRAAVIWTISDFPAYSMLSGMSIFICLTFPFFANGFIFSLFLLIKLFLIGWSTSGKYACPYCMEETDAFSLKHG